MNIYGWCIGVELKQRVKKNLIIIFSDLDGTILHKRNFKFDKIKKYIKKLISHKIILIPNTSKTELEIKDFIKELGIKLPFICENGSAIYNKNNTQQKYKKYFRNIVCNSL